ncbi:ATP-binding protein [Candidatus Pacearchaeota archaeon]|nr:ATP-binding protein [Candidatus Pacearchaeota archaeon]
MDKTIIKEYMRKVNPWWNENFKSLNIEYTERDIFKEIIKYMSLRMIIALTGLRRVGKTTLAMKIVEQKILDSFDKKQILYFSFDDFSEIRIMELIDIYEEIFGKVDRGKKYLIVFDEIQKIKDWSNQLKVVYDIYPNIKFIISGSESLFIRKKSKESLAGRIFEFKVNPLTFKEFLRFRKIKIDNIFIQRDEILKNFNQFLITNGFPEIINYNENDARKYITEGIIEKTIYSDFVQVFEVKRTDIIRSIFNIIYNEPGQIIDIQDLSKELGISRGILSNYLEYLEEAFLIKKLYNYSRNARKTQRRLKKFFSTLTNHFLMEHNFGKIFEQFITLQLNAEYFWRDSFKNEVDVILLDPLRAIEIKSGEIKERDLTSLEKFIKKFKPEEVKVLSYNIEKVIGGVQIIPFYKYLLK